MAIQTKLLHKLSQSLLMTPQLQQAIKLLQLGRLEYIEAIEQELLQNPLLEKDNFDEQAISAPETSSTPEKPEFDSSQEFEQKLQEATVTDWDSYLESFHDSSSPHTRDSGSERNIIEECVAAERSLYDDLLSQVIDLDNEEVSIPLISYLIGNLDHRGFLSPSLEEIAESIDVSIEEITKAHELLLTLDPAGVGARNLPECLLVQIDRLGRKDQIEGLIVKNHLELLEKRRYDQIAKSLGVGLEEVREALQFLSRLDPYPARQYAQEPPRYQVPDVYIQRDGSEFRIILNDEGIPRLRINSEYSKILKDEKDKSIKDYHSEMQRSATWLLKSIDQRQRTIYKVTESIVKFQRDFLTYGVSHLRPLVLKEVADDIGMHESTVSRITSNKCVHTPQGIFELKFFFTTGIRTKSGEISSSAVKVRIKQIIDQEEPENPVSDQHLVDLLKGENIEIARRTVAKYRESLGIASSSKRKSLF